MRLLVCGSRTLTTGHVVYRGMLEEMNAYGITLVIHGGATGADTFADLWAKSHSIPVHCYPAQWQLYGDRAGPIRNRQMLIEGDPDRILACVDKSLDLSHGTAHMVRIARQAGVPTRVVPEHFA